MNEENKLPLPTPEEAAAADALAREFLAQISAVPVDERKVLTSDKFAGAIAEPASDNLDQGDK